jgi:hypothetical protein
VRITEGGRARRVQAFRSRRTSLYNQGKLARPVRCLRCKVPTRQLFVDTIYPRVRRCKPCGLAFTRAEARAGERR